VFVFVQLHYIGDRGLHEPTFSSCSHMGLAQLGLCLVGLALPGRLKMGPHMAINNA